MRAHALRIWRHVYTHGSNSHTPLPDGAYHISLESTVYWLQSYDTHGSCNRYWREQMSIKERVSHIGWRDIIGFLAAYLCITGTDWLMRELVWFVRPWTTNLMPKCSFLSLQWAVRAERMGGSEVLFAVFGQKRNICEASKAFLIKTLTYSSSLNSWGFLQAFCFGKYYPSEEREAFNGK